MAAAQTAESSLPDLQVGGRERHSGNIKASPTDTPPPITP